MEPWWQDVSMMAARLALQFAAGALVARGLIEAGAVDALSGLALSALGAWLSHRARQALKAAP